MNTRQCCGTLVPKHGPHPRRCQQVSVKKVLGAAALAVALTACSSGGSGGAGTPQGEKSFSVGVTTSFLSHLTPGRSVASNVDYALFTPLTTVDATSGKAVNAVAESIESD